MCVTCVRSTVLFNIAQYTYLHLLLTYLVKLQQYYIYFEAKEFIFNLTSSALLQS